VWTDAATVVLWRTAPDEVPPPTDEAFSAQVDRAITEMPDDIRDRIQSIHEEHQEPVVRDHLLDWTFFGGWRWGDGWVTDESGGYLMQGCSVLSFISQSADVADATEGVGVAVLAD